MLCKKRRTLKQSGIHKIRPTGFARIKAIKDIFDSLRGLISKISRLSCEKLLRWQNVLWSSTKDWKEKYSFNMFALVFQKKFRVQSFIGDYTFKLVKIVLLRFPSRCRTDANTNSHRLLRFASVNLYSKFVLQHHVVCLVVLIDYGEIIH